METCIIMDVHLERPTLLDIIGLQLVLSHFFERNNGEQALGEICKRKASLKYIEVKRRTSIGENIPTSAFLQAIC